MKEILRHLAQHQVWQAESYLENHRQEINIEGVSPEQPEWEFCNMPSTWTPANWAWFISINQ